jgi:hypothetical protein
VRVFFDTEFIEDGRTIDLLSIGAVRDDGQQFYAEPKEADRSKASDWVKRNVFPHLFVEIQRRTTRADIAADFVVFAGEKPEFWAYCADYDWVALCQLYGTMMSLPNGWPMYCRDVKQLCDDVGNPSLQKREGEHNALVDAVWAKDAWALLQGMKKL